MVVETWHETPLTWCKWDISLVRAEHKCNLATSWNHCSLLIQTRGTIKLQMNRKHPNVLRCSVGSHLQAKIKVLLFDLNVTVPSNVARIFHDGRPGEVVRVFSRRSGHSISTSGFHNLVRLLDWQLYKRRSYVIREAVTREANML